MCFGLLLLWNGSCTTICVWNDLLHKFNLEDICTNGYYMGHSFPINAINKWMLSSVLQPFLHKDDEEGQRQQHNMANKKLARAQSPKKTARK